MLTIRLQFPGKRYHATPWDHHVNEGVVEWPPTPWRILRAIVAVWHRKANDIEEASLRHIIETLAKEQPEYYLPPAVASHTRHYMPPFNGNTTKVFDAFFHIESDQHLDISYPNTQLDPKHEVILAALLDRLSYLGRAESWVEANIVAQGSTSNCKPQPSETDTVPKGEIVRVLSPVAPEQYGLWRAAEVDKQLTGKLAELKQKKGDATKIGKKDRLKIETAIPSDLFAALHQDTSDIRKLGWSLAPGAHWVAYQRPVIRANQTSGKGVSRNSMRPTVARFVVVGKLAPMLTHVVSFAEVVRKTLLYKSDGHLVFRGREREGNSPAQGHQHCFILPESTDNSGRIRQFTVYAKMGFDQAAQEALHKMQSLYAGDSFDVKATLVGIGNGSDFVGRESPSILGVARQWLSRTPFVCTRHAKWSAKGPDGKRKPKLDNTGMHIGSPEHDLCRLLMGANLPRPVSVTSVRGTVLRNPTEWRHFQRWRKRGGGSNAGYGGNGYLVDFGELVEGPISVGYGAHFGLGMFAPIGMYKEL